ncbi:MAG: NAD(P)-dependent oxidoreductase [Planctomycetes bacterium]|nr:NAD(P)-dependent oxidoreductase [Planctomycetota bacterium]
MKILFTGASSFTGCWFVRELAAAGHEVVATFQRKLEDYSEPLRRERVMWASQVSRPVFNCSFGDDRFLETIRQGGPWDILCHHAANVTDYKSPDFNVNVAIAANSLNLTAVLRDLTESGCRGVVLTGSFFENDEGAGSQDLPAVSPYGLSKGLTAQIFRYYTSIMGLHFAKFVIPNPFGPHEEPRFTTYLIRNWKEGKNLVVSTPAYVRDNIHVTLLAKAYTAFVATRPLGGASKLNPSGYVESQGAFAHRFASEMRPRLGCECPLTLKTQTEFSEPRVRLNTDVLDVSALGWNECLAWDQIAEFYGNKIGT